MSNCMHTLFAAGLCLDVERHAPDRLRLHLAKHSDLMSLISRLLHVSRMSLACVSHVSRKVLLQQASAVLHSAPELMYV